MTSFAELGGLAGLALADHLGRRLEQADELVLSMFVATEDASLGLAHHLTYQRDHVVERLAQAIQDRLLGDLGAALDAGLNLAREAFGLPTTRPVASSSRP